MNSGRNSTSVMHSSGRNILLVWIVNQKNWQRGAKTGFSNIYLEQANEEKSVFCLEFVGFLHTVA
jgi:hypothetical protein